MVWGARFGNTVLLHLEDMSYANLTRLFNQYRGSLACFSDDVQVSGPASWFKALQQKQNIPSDASVALGAALEPASFRV